MRTMSRRHELRRRLAVITGVAMLLALNGPVSTALASPAPPKPAGVSTMATADQALAQAKASGTSVAVAGATTPTDTLTANPDGSLTLTRTVLPARKRVAGTWKNLDATLVRNSDGSISPAVTTTDLTLSGGGTGPFATLHGNAGAALALTLPASLPTPTLSGNTATYHDVLPGVDLQVTADIQGGISDVLVVNDATAAANPALQPLTFATNATGVTVSVDAAGNITATNPSGQAMFTAPAPLMWDSTTASSPAATRAKTDSASGTAVDASTGEPVTSSTDGPGEGAHTAPVTVVTSGDGIDLSPNQALLTGSTTTYPVYIDPSWSTTEEKNIGWATVAQQYGDTNYWDKTTDPHGYMQVGQGAGILSRTFVNFTIPVSALTGAVIDSATMTLTENYSWSCDARQVDLYAPSATLTQNDATWNFWNGQNIGGIVNHQTVAHGYDSSCPAAGVGFTVTGTVNSDVTNHKSIQTFALLADNESDQYSWKKFTASTAALTITYDHKPATPTALHTSPVTSCTANPPTAIGDGPVSLYAGVSDPDGGSLGVTFSLTRTSDGKQEASSDPNKLTYGSGATAVLVVPEATLKAAAGTTPTEFSWHVQVTDTSYPSNWSTTCNFIFDPSRTGQPDIVAPPEGTTIGAAASFEVNPPATGTVPTSYEYQLNGTAPNTIPATNGHATISIKPTAYTNTLTVTGLSLGGNIGDTAAEIFNSTAPAPAAPEDLTGDGNADLLTVGGTNNLSPGLWVASGFGDGEISPAALDIGANGNGSIDNAPADFTGAHAISGHFTGGNLQDVLAFYPASDSNPARGVVLRGNGDGSTIQAQSGENVFPVDPDELADFFGDYPTQIANAGDSAGLHNGFPDLIAVSSDPAIGSYLDYYPNGGVSGSYQLSDPLTDVTTPDGMLDWNNWTIATCQLADGTTAMYLWNPTTGALHLWENLTHAPGTTGLDVGHKYILADGTTSKWNQNQHLTLQAAEINSDGAHLWTVGTDGTETAWLATLDTTPTITHQTPQSLTTPTHSWSLNTMTTGTVTAPDAAGNLALTGTTGTTWNDGDLYDPDARLDGATGALTTPTPALATNADFSVSLWLKPTSAGGVALSENGTNTAALKVWAEASDSSWRVAMPTTDTANPTYDTAAANAGTLRLSIWTHLTVTFNKATGVLTLYVDGVTAASVTHTTTWNNATGNLHIGNARTSTSGYGSYLTGQISSIQVWNHVITPTQTTTPASYYQPIPATRFLDTRTSGNPVAARSTTKLQIANKNGLPGQDITAVALNLTALQESGAGFLTVYPDNSPPPFVTNLYYFQTQTTIANFVIAPVGADGYIDISNNSSSTTHLLADVTGYFTSDATKSGNTTYTPLPNSQRILDTRNGTGAPAGQVTSGSALTLQIAGAAEGLPTTGITAVALNLTVTRPTGDGFLTAYPADGTSRPLTSNVQYTAGQTIADLAIVPVAASNGKIKIYTSATTDIIADVAGYFTTSTTGQKYHAINYTRMIDTRQTGGPVESNDFRPVAQGETVIAPNPTLILNITVTQPTDEGAIIVYPGGTPTPTTSNQNWTAGLTLSALALTPTGNGIVDIKNSGPGTVQLVVDCLGYFSAN